MTDAEALDLLTELQNAFRRPLPEDSIQSYRRAIRDSSAEQGRDGVDELIRNEEHFPSIAVLRRYIGRPSDGGISEHDRQKGIKQLAEDCRHMARLRSEPFADVVQGHLAMCEENLDITGDEETWGERARWCRELLRRETGNTLPGRHREALPS